MAVVSLSDISLETKEESRPQWSVVVGTYRYVLYNDGRALVYKGESTEPNYEITRLGCSCPADRYRSDACKHRKAISFLGDSGTFESSEDENAEVVEESTDPTEVDIDGLDLDDILG